LSLKLLCWLQELHICRDCVLCCRISSAEKGRWAQFRHI
jgi:hypothetical protein